LPGYENILHSVICPPDTEADLANSPELMDHQAAGVRRLQHAGLVPGLDTGGARRFDQRKREYAKLVKRLAYTQ